MCKSCASEIIFIKEQACPGCNRLYLSGKYCPKCRRNKRLVGVLAATYLRNENAKKLVHELKYHGYFAIAPTLAEYMVSCLGRTKFDLVAFVPITKKRLRKRGYNQSKELAKSISKLTGRPLLEGFQKVKETKTQVGLKKRARGGNLVGAFCYYGADLKNKRVLLVDDVKTTGATLNACAQELKRAGATSVWGLVFAKE